MASYERVEGKRGARWRAHVERQGYRKSKTFSTKKEAERWARGIESNIDSGQLFDSRIGQGLTLDEVWADYMQDRSIEWAEATAHTITVVGKSLGELGKRPVQSIRRTDIQAWVRELSARYAPGTVRLYVAHVGSCLDWAVRGGLIQTSPMDDHIVLPPAPRRGQRLAVLSDEQLEILCETVRAGKASVSEDRARLVRVLGTAGMRWGEAVALTVDDVSVGDDGSCTVEIHRGISTVGSRPIVTGLKTASSHRRIPVFGAAAEALMEQVGDAKAAGRDLLWVTVSGGPMTSPTGSSWWHTAVRSEACSAAGVPADLRIHDLRHTAATRLLQRGVPITAVSRYLGHAKTSTTLDVYAHYIQGDDAAIRAAMYGEG